MNVHSNKERHLKNVIIRDLKQVATIYHDMVYCGKSTEIWRATVGAYSFYMRVG